MGDLREALSAFRADATPIDPSTQPETLLEPVSPLSGEILGVDQTLGASGWVHLQVTPGECPCFKLSGTLRTDLPLDGKVQAQFARADQLFVHFCNLIDLLEPSLIVHEMPGMGLGVGMRNPESSIMAATVLHCAAMKAGVETVMVHHDHATKVVTGNGRASKGEVKDAIYAGLVKNLPKRMNTDVSDAIALVLTYRYDKEQS